MTDRITAILGDFEFGIDTAAYESLQRSSAYRWAQNDVLLAHPKLQYAGPGDDAIQLEGVIFTSKRQDLTLLDRLRDMAKAGEAYTLVVAPGLTGEVLGKWVIENVSQTNRADLPGGVPRVIEFQLALKFYGEI